MQKEEYGNKPLAGATIVMMPICQNGIKTASFLYAGTNTNILPSLISIPSYIQIAPRISEILAASEQFSLIPKTLNEK